MALKDIKKYNIRTPYKLKGEFWVDIMSSEIFEIWRHWGKCAILFFVEEMNVEVIFAVMNTT